RQLLPPVRRARSGLSEPARSGSGELHGARRRAVLVAPLAARGPQRGVGIDAGAVGAADADLEVQLRPGRVTRATQQPDDVALRDDSTDPDELRHVRVVVDVAVGREEIRRVPTG